MKRYAILTALLLALAAVPLIGPVTPAAAAILAYEFNDPAKEARFKQLSEELRCLVCQNQNLADSNADLARDLRRELYEMIQAGKSDEEIISFMVARYGDFVLYRPPVKPITFLLWVGPLLLFLGGVLTLILMIRSWGRTRQDTALDAEEQRRLDDLLRKNEEKLD